MDNALYASMDVLDVDECNMLHFCENVSMSDDPYDCDAMLHESLGVVDIPNIKLFKKRLRNFIKIWASYFVKMMIWLLGSMNPTNWLRNIRNLLKILLKSWKSLSNKLVDELKCENESLMMHAKCLIAEPIVKNDKNICCNHVVVLNFVPIMCFTSKDKSIYIPPYKRNQKEERKAVKSKPPFRS